jgi:hypothetical protein
MDARWTPALEHLQYKKGGGSGKWSSCCGASRRGCGGEGIGISNFSWVVGPLGDSNSNSISICVEIIPFRIWKRQQLEFVSSAWRRTSVPRTVACCASVFLRNIWDAENLFVCVFFCVKLN